MWREPKTNWKAGDFFNIEDYNRIKGNLESIHEQSLMLWSGISFEEMGGDKTYSDYGFYADEINRFERNIRHFCNGIFPFPVGEAKSYYDNQPFIGWEDLNRIEEACRLIYSNVQSRINGRKLLSFTLNGGAFE